MSTVEARAMLSEGRSSPAVYRMATRVIRERHAGGGTLLDVGCGTGAFWASLRDRFATYIGVDAVAYDGFPAAARFVRAELDRAIPLPDGSAEVVAALEVIEHLENPRAFMRELARLAKPGGWVIVTTPNQLSALSLLTLAVKGHFSAFQEVHYPAHLTALLESDLRHVAAECGLQDAAIAYSGEGRIVLTALLYPASLSAAFPRLCSDNVLLAARRAA